MRTQCGWVLAAVVLGVIGPDARALDVAAPTSYKRAVPGGRFMFVMIAPPLMPGANGPPVYAGADRRAYPRSGLYRADGPPVPVWTVDWYAYQGHVEVAPDGVHLVRRGWWAVSGDEAVSFVANGELLRTYSRLELGPRPPRSAYGLHEGPWYSVAGFDPDRYEYALTDHRGGRFVFDVRTGAITSDPRPGRAARGVAGVTLAAAVLGLSGWLAGRRLVRAWVARLARDSGG